MSNDSTKQHIVGEGATLSRWPGNLFVACLSAGLFMIIALATLKIYQLNPNSAETVKASRDLLEPFLLLSAVVCITAMVLLVKFSAQGTVIVVIAILLIGTVVAGQRVVIAITAAWGDLQAEVLDSILKDEGYGEKRDYAAADQAKAQQATAGASSGATEDQALVFKRQAEEFAVELVGIARDPTLSDSEAIEAVAQRLNAARTSLVDAAEVAKVASTLANSGRLLTPFWALYDGATDPKVWTDFVADYLGTEIFQADMAALRDMNLAAFDGSNVAAATLTEFGKRVGYFLDSGGVTDYNQVVELDPLVVLSFAERTQGPVTPIEIGPDLPTVIETGNMVDAARFWYEVTVTAAGTYRFKTLGDFEGVPSFIDSVLRLLTEDGMTLIENDDAGPETIFSEIVIDLEPGIYNLAVTDFQRLGGVFFLSAGPATPAAAE